MSQKYSEWPPVDREFLNPVLDTWVSLGDIKSTYKATTFSEPDILNYNTNTKIRHNIATMVHVGVTEKGHKNYKCIIKIISIKCFLKLCKIINLHSKNIVRHRTNSFLFYYVFSLSGKKKTFCTGVWAKRCSGGCSETKCFLKSHCVGRFHMSHFTVTISPKKHDLEYNN